MVIRRSFWAGKRVFVTGHTGFKGSWFVLWLEAMGAQVGGFALAPATRPSMWALVESGTDVDSTIDDLRDLGSLEGAIARFRPEIVFHLAAQALVRASYDDPVGTYATNVMGTVHLLDAVRRSRSVRAVIVVTSDKCYENRERTQGYREDEPMGGRDPYSSSKGCAELVTAAYRASFFASGPGIASTRAGNVIGGGDWSADRIVPDIVRAAAAGEPVKVRNPNAVRPWQHVLEPLSGYLQLAERLYENPGEFAEAWNFGPSDEDAVPVQTVVSAATRLWGPGASWTADPGPHPHEANFLRLDSSKARHRLDWVPRLRLQDALDWTIGWYRAQAAGSDAAMLTRGQIERYMELAGT